MGASGSTVINFGDPGKLEKLKDISGQTGLIATSLIEAWVLPIDNVDEPNSSPKHNEDEHLIERITVRARWKIDGTFTIRGSTDEYPPPTKMVNNQSGSGDVVEKQILVGNYTIGWVWI